MVTIDGMAPVWLHGTSSHHDDADWTAYIVKYVSWCMSGLLTRVAGENVPSFRDACATRDLTYLARGPCHGAITHTANKLPLTSSMEIYFQYLKLLHQNIVESRVEIRNLHRLVYVDMILIHVLISMSDELNPVRCASRSNSFITMTQLWNRIAEPTVYIHTCKSQSAIADNVPDRGAYPSTHSLPVATFMIIIHILLVSEFIFFNLKLSITVHETSPDVTTL